MRCSAAQLARSWGQVCVIHHVTNSISLYKPHLQLRHCMRISVVHVCIVKLPRHIRSSTPCRSAISISISISISINKRRSRIRSTLLVIITEHTALPQTLVFGLPMRLHRRRRLWLMMACTLLLLLMTTTACTAAEPCGVVRAWRTHGHELQRQRQHQYRQQSDVGWQRLDPWTASGP